MIIGFRMAAVITALVVGTVIWFLPEIAFAASDVMTSSHQIHSENTWKPLENKSKEKR